MRLSGAIGCPVGKRKNHLICSRHRMPVSKCGLSLLSKFLALVAEKKKTESTEKNTPNVKKAAKSMVSVLNQQTSSLIILSPDFNI